MQPIKKKWYFFSLSPDYGSSNVQLLWSCCSVFEVKEKYVTEEEDKMKTDNWKKFDLIILTGLICFTFVTKEFQELCQRNT